jgi:hypothetical protein
VTDDGIPANITERLAQGTAKARAARRESGKIAMCDSVVSLARPLHHHDIARNSVGTINNSGVGKMGGASGSDESFRNREYFHARFGRREEYFHGRDALGSAHRYTRLQDALKGIVDL